MNARISTTSSGLLAATAVLTIAALAGCSSQAEAAPGTDVAYPEDNITLIVPYPAGSGPDAGARLIAQELEKELSTRVIVENKEGGASTIGLFELAGSEPDGYTIGLGSFSGISLQSRLVENPFEGLDTLTPIAQTKLPSFLLFGAADSGWESVDDFIEDAKSRPGQITVAIPNANSVPDVLVKLLEESAGIDIEPVYFDAGAQVLPVVNGTTDAGVAQAAPVVQFVDAGDLAFVGAFGSNAPEGLDVPLFDESGYDTSQIADYEGFFGPAGLPDEIVDILSAAIEKAVESDAYQELMTTTFSTGMFVGGKEFADEARSLDDTAVELIESLNLGK